MANLNLKEAIRRLEKAFIRRAMVEADGNQTKAASILGISRRALIYKLAEYGLAVGR
jgi:transcriptional regulator with PAS, ATPase and Fis domain